MGRSIEQIYEGRVAEGQLTPDPAQRAALPALEEIRAHFEAAPSRPGLLGGLFSRPPEPPRGLYLWGGVGRGKSMLMDLFFHAVPIRDKRRVHFHAFMQEIHAGMHAARRRGGDDALRPVAEKIADEARLLCFDEMQITDITDAMIVGRLFEILFDAGVVVVTTSNRVPDDLYKEGLNRALFLPFIELIKARLRVHHLEAQKDYRQDRLAGAETYFHPADARARAEIERLWQELTGGEAAPLTLTVQGREVVLPAYHNGVGRAAFWDLCGRMLGPADYLAVADALRVLVLEEIPCLGRSNFNEAKRFVTLVDALYEARVRVIASAADVPERLYLEGEGSFEFERTASRLREMQAEGWGEAAAAAAVEAEAEEREDG
jgi:cell division protein ZapE